MPICGIPGNGVQCYNDDNWKSHTAQNSKPKVGKGGPIHLHISCLFNYIVLRFLLVLIEESMLGRVTPTK